MRFFLVGCVLVVAAAPAGAGEPGPPPVMPAVVFAQARVDTAPPVRGVKALKSTMKVVAAEEVPGLRRWQREKSPRVAVLSNMLLPGLGQAYNGRRWKTAIMVGVATFYGGSAWVQQRRAEARRHARDQFPYLSTEWREHDLFYEFHKANSIDFRWWSGAVWLIGALDAFVDAHLYDVRSVDPTIFQGTGNQKYVGLSLRL